MDGEIAPDELQSLLDGTHGDDPAALRVVDIRTPGAFARGHIPGSENIPASELAARIEELHGADRVVTVCPHGEASVQAARLVGSARGIDGPVESLAGGLEAWDGPLETGAGAGASDGAADADGPTAPF